MGKEKSRVKEKKEGRTERKERIDIDNKQKMIGT